MAKPGKINNKKKTMAETVHKKQKKNPHDMSSLVFPDVPLIDLDLFYGAMPSYAEWRWWDGDLSTFEEYPKKKLYDVLGVVFNEADARDEVRMLDVDEAAIARLAAIIRMDTGSPDFERLEHALANEMTADFEYIGEYGYKVMCVISTLMLNGRTPNSRYNNPHWDTGDYGEMGQGGIMIRSSDFTLHKAILSGMETATFQTGIEEGKAAEYHGRIRACQNRICHVDKIYMNRNTAVISFASGKHVCQLGELWPVFATCEGVRELAPCSRHQSMHPDVGGPV